MVGCVVVVGGGCGKGFGGVVAWAMGEIIGGGGVGGVICGGIVATEGGVAVEDVVKGGVFGTVMPRTENAMEALSCDVSMIENGPTSSGTRKSNCCGVWSLISNCCVFLFLFVLGATPSG